ncbi:TetR/AcrR family transcriptional regulator [Nocardia sp. NPDC060249]|uniref:TetR/AcrR family transcriptional regulator n=1 Tax=Nocardia sp. NPDC060249 TaxID=3347082 RepID=UPI0036495571
MSHPIPERGLRADALRNRQRLIHAAHEMFAEHGLDVTLDDIARHAGVGIGTMYRRFRDKDELIDAVFEQNFTDMAEAAEAAASATDPWPALVAYFEFACERMAGSRGMTATLERIGHGCDQVGVQSARIEAAVEKLAQRAKDDGSLRPDTIPTDFFGLIFTVGALADITRTVDPTAWRRHLALILDGLNNDHRPRRPLPLPAPATRDTDNHTAEQPPRVNR